MRATLIRLRTPMIRFLGRRSHPSDIDHTPRVHPQSPANELPTSFSFAKYRQNAQTHGPLGGKGRNGAIEAAEGEFFARRDLPRRLQYSAITDLEIENVNSGGAEVVY